MAWAQRPDAVLPQDGGGVGVVRHGEAGVATGETSVVLTQVHARARATGRELGFPILQTITVKDGRITEVRPVYWDTRAIADVCTVPTSAPPD
ncbi:nuclear transport factor 2 family protein [Streptomyces sp. NPDC016309]|uniref:nuclear transport factor 2 family protein n=1 Tax=Streptomyces sp. NPDC016309 TaxID=3364965 RepID=UPI003701FD95